jgi:hypothetical protein
MPAPAADWILWKAGISPQVPNAAELLPRSFAIILWPALTRKECKPWPHFWMPCSETLSNFASFRSNSIGSGLCRRRFGYSWLKAGDPKQFGWDKTNWNA